MSMPASSRRTFLLAALAGSGAVYVSQHWALTKLNNAQTQSAISPSERELWRALLPVVLQAYWPNDASAAASLSEQVLPRIEAAIALQSPRIQNELHDLFALLDSFAGSLLVGGEALAWPAVTNDQLEHLLVQMREHAVALLQTAYAGIHNLIMASYWADDAHWDQAGYSAPQPVR